ncbi:LytR/AlgR family response regulator transcription factor [Sphingobacterium humi]|uniref:HTH LytTR-type domain-containing protein n=1 Tax=Sphingobacterium humi TaxID=1796905 RepID=A0A6N8L340_9SPHI|nr:LytTR family DNA-binding domain-containing protein [Sphingobacterium humi]MVZ63756.1 hypothetical protein [Sphingobacterium humi]
MLPAVNPVTTYRDTQFRVIGALTAAHFMSVFGDEQPLGEILLSFNYWVALACGTLIAFGVMSVVRCATLWLDKRYDWLAQPLLRVLLQALFGWVIPSFTAFLLAALYFAAFGFNILNSLYLRIDFPVIVLLILLFNVYYFCYYLFQRKHQEQDKTETAAADKSVFIVHTTARSIPIRVEEICYICIIEGSTFLRTFGMPAIQDAYAVPETLKDMEALLDSRLFFRINRQMIVSFHAVAAFRPGKGQSLEITLQPPLHEGKAKDMPDHLQRLLTVSEERVTPFKKWMDR